MTIRVTPDNVGRIVQACGVDKPDLAAQLRASTPTQWNGVTCEVDPCGDSLEYTLAYGLDYARKRITVTPAELAGIVKAGGAMLVQVGGVRA